jgi:hypothetical protein
MRILDIINKLEDIKHNYLIYALEKYTDQITSEDIKKKEEERKKQEEVAKEEVKKLAEEVKKPVEEVKKPAEEVKKFENNIMDSLKWVFIGMGIFIFIMIVLSLIYWFLFSSNNNEQNINGPDNINQNISPPVNQYISPPVNQNISPPVNQYISPKNTDNAKEGEGSIFSFLTPFSKNEKPPEIISKAPTEVDLEAKPISESRIISNAQTDIEEYLENVSKLNTNKIVEDNNASKIILSPVKEDNNINEYKKEVSKI